MEPRPTALSAPNAGLQLLISLAISTNERHIHATLSENSFACVQRIGEDRLTLSLFTVRAQAENQPAEQTAEQSRSPR